MCNFEVLKKEIESSMDEISHKEIAVFEIRDKFDQQTVPMWVDVERIHAEVDNVNDVLFVLVVACLSFLLVVLEDNGVGLLEGIVIVQQGLDQFVNAKLFDECELLELASRKESVLESA